MSCTREEKCKEAVSVLGALGELEVLCVGSLAVEAVDPSIKWGTQHVDELDLLIHHADLDEFMKAMESREYRLAEWKSDAKPCVPVGSSKQVKADISRMPVSPEYNYVPKSCIHKPKEPHLWITFHTTTRHGRLTLADLAEWFDGKEKYEVEFGLTVYRPPRWAVLLWQAAEVTCMAAEFSADSDDLNALRHNVDRLSALARDPELDWQDVLDKSGDYRAEYRVRLGLPAVGKRLEAYQKHLGLNDEDMKKAEGQYDARYELTHALRAVEDTVPHDIWAKLEPIISSHPRKLWAYPDVKGHRPVFPPKRPEGKLGIAEHDFGIREQLMYHQNNPGATFDDLVTSGHIRQLIPSKENGPKALAHGLWGEFTKTDMKNIGLP